MTPHIKQDTRQPTVDASNQRIQRVLGFVLLVGFVLFSMFLVTATHLPRIPPIARGPGIDKWLHFSAYVCQTVLAMGVLYFTDRLVLKHVVFLIFVLTTFGAVDELTQPMFHRQAELFDWLADCAGVLFGVCSVWLLASIRKNKPRERSTS